MGNVKITASIVLYNTKVEDIEAVLCSVINSQIELLYIIDNSPTDILRSLFDCNPSYIYIYGHGNVGYGSGHNIALKRVIELGYHVHFIINPDVVFNGNVITKIFELMNSDCSIGQVMPKVYYPNGQLQYLCKLIPTPIDLIFKRFIPSKLNLYNDVIFQLKFTGYNKIMNVPYLSGCFMALRLSVLKDIGLFDERFFMYPEDIDLTRRIHEKYKTLYYPEVSIVHAHAAESKTSYKMLWIHIWNMIKYFNKWGWCFDKKRRFYNRRLINDLKLN